MRLLSILTAILVAAAIFIFVFQRDLLSSDSGEDAGSTVVATSSAPAPQADDGPAPVSVVVLRSTAQTIDSAVKVRGQTEAARQVNLFAETSGTVISTPLRKGTFVTAGQAMCSLDPGTRQASLDEAKARLAEARARVPESKARLSEAEARLEEAIINDNAAEKLLEGGFASETRVAATRAAKKSASAGVAAAQSGLESTIAGIQSAQAAVAIAEREIERLTISASFDGILESDTAELGSLLQPGALCATVIQLDPIKLTGFVPEIQIAQVKLGANAGARLATGESAVGKVSFVSRSADAATRTFRVEIQVPNNDLSIRDGQTAEIIIAADGKMAHLVPGSALTLDNDGALGVRTVAEDNIVKFRPVSVLRDTVDGMWIDGLDQMEDVIVVGQEYVIDGVTVLPTYQE